MSPRRPPARARQHRTPAAPEAPRMARSAILQRGKQGNPDPVAAEYGTVTGWRPLGHGQAVWEQIGVYGDAYLNQFPAYYNQPQLHSAVEWLWDAWYTPSVSVVPTF